MATRKKAPSRKKQPYKYRVIKSRAQTASEQKLVFKAVQVIATELDPFDRETQGRIIRAVEEITGITAK